MTKLPHQDGIDDITRRQFGRGELTNQQHRHLRILNHLTSTGIAASTTELWEVVGQDQITKRQFQRDLEHMVQTYSIECDERGRSKYWSIKAGTTPRFVLPVLDENAALAFHLAQSLLEEILPANIVGSLTPWFSASKNLLLAKNPDNPWYERLTSKREGIQLEPPTIDPPVLAALYLALQKGEEIKIEHIRAGGQKKEHVITPAGIVASNQTLYLLAYNVKHKDYTSYAIHRIAQATARYTPASAPDVADFLDYVEEGFNEFYVSEDEITLIVDFHPHAQRKMLEYQLAEDQQQEVLSDKWLRVKATLYPTGSLLTWLLGYGKLVRVIGPPDLVKRLDEMRQAPPAPPLDAPL